MKKATYSIEYFFKRYRNFGQVEKYYNNNKILLSGLTKL